MKIVIQTQVRENYGDANKPYWKFKGGDTYIVPNLSVDQVMKVKDQGIPTLKALIETRNEGFEEYIIDWSILDDDAAVCEEYETPTELFWEQGGWVARRTTENGEYGYMRHEIARKTEKYEMLMGGDRANYTVAYVMRSGETLTSDGLEEYFKVAA